MTDLRTYSRNSFAMVSESLRAIDDGLPPGHVAKAQLKDFVEGESPRREGKGRGTMASASSAGLLTPRAGSGGPMKLMIVARSDGRGLSHAARKGCPRPGSRPSFRVIEGGAHAASLV